MKEYTYVFIDSFQCLYPDSSATKWLIPIAYKEKDFLVLSAYTVSFSKFIIYMQNFVALNILRRFHHDKPTATLDFVWYKMSNNVTSLIAKADCQDKETLLYADSTPMQKLYIFKNLSSITCNLKKHTIRPERISVPLLNSDGFVPLPIHYCMSCGKRFVGIETLKVYEKEFGKLFVQTEEDLSVSASQRKYLGESELHRAGYNVIEGKMTAKERRILLVKLLETGTLTDFQIHKDIENAIRIFEDIPKYTVAVEKWKSDILFLGEYIKRHI